MNSENTIVFSTPDSMYFAEKIAKQLGVPVGKIVISQFSGGETYRRLDIESRTSLFGKDVIFVGSTHSDQNIDSVYDFGCALAQYGTRQRIFIVPFLGYSTMERGVKIGEVVKAKTVMRKFSSIPNSRMGNIFLFMDLHVSGLIHYMEGDCVRFELYAEEILLDAIRKQKIQTPFVFGSADLGRTKWVKTFAKAFETNLVLIDKGREGERVTVDEVIGNVSGKHVVVYDDMARSANSLIEGAEAYLSRGALSVGAVISHFAANDLDVVERIEHSPLKFFITTNTHPMSQIAQVQKSEKFIVADVSNIFAMQIMKLLR